MARLGRAQPWVKIYSPSRGILFFRGFFQTLTETITDTDSIIKTTSRTLSETLTDTDTLIKTTSRILTETVTHLDTVLKLTSRILSETIVHVDTILKTTSRTLTETVTHTDAIVKTAGKVLNETLSIIASLGEFILNSLNRGRMRIRRYFRDEVPEVITRDNNKPTDFGSHDVEKPKLR